MEKYQDIDKRIEPLLRALETTGIPLREKRLLRRIHASQRNLVDLKQTINREVGFMVDLDSDESRDRATRAYAEKMSRVPVGEQTVIDQLFYSQVAEASLINKVLKADQRVYTLASANKKTGKAFAIYPSYRIGDMGKVETYGEITLKEAFHALQDMMGATGQILIRAFYPNLEWRVLQTLSGDPDLAGDLEGRSERNLVGRMYEKNRTSRAIARMAVQVFMSGGGPEELVQWLNPFGKADPSFYFCLERAEILHIKWRNLYPQAADYLDDLAQAGNRYGHVSSYFGRKDTVSGDRSRAVSFPIRSTAIDLAKAGFADLYEDYRFQRLSGRVVTVMPRSIVVMVDRGVDKEDLVEVLMSTLTNANPGFSPRVRIKVGTSLAQLL